MDRELLALLMEYLLSRQMSGFNDPGTDIPYDDYGMQQTIGGLGAVDANTYPYEDWGDTGIGGSAAEQFAPAGSIGGGWIPPMLLGPPNLPPYRPQPVSESPRAQQFAPVIAQLQGGLEQRQARTQPAPKPPEKERTVKTLPKPASPAASPQTSQAVRRISTAGTNAVRTQAPVASPPKYQGPMDLLARKTNAVRKR
jgi:hypothetical protein